MATHANIVLLMGIKNAIIWYVIVYQKKTFELPISNSCMSTFFCLFFFLELESRRSSGIITAFLSVSEDLMAKSYFFSCRPKQTVE